MLAQTISPPSPSTAPLQQHGGRISAARQAFPEAPDPWLDLSTGISPHSYPVPGLPADIWRRLPDPASQTALEAAARHGYDAPDVADVVAAPGTQALIQLLPRAWPARQVAILGFGYQEHAAAWERAGASVSVMEDCEALAAADIAVVVNPNNPDGRHVMPDVLASLARRMRGRGGTLVVDEAFVDTLPAGASLVPRLSGSGALVLRSFGKFFGLAGLRLGFALGDPALCDALRTALGPWAVSGPALAIGAHALADRPWRDAMRNRLRADAMRLDALLAEAGCTVVGGTSLFRLVRHPDAPALFASLGRAGILVRPFAQEPTWLRVGLPGTEPEWARLAEALGAAAAPADQRTEMA